MKNPLVGMNRRRASWALSALKHFCKTTGLNLKADRFETAVSDLLGDLMHLCDSKKKTLLDLMAHGYKYYLMEIAWKCKKCKRRHDAEADGTLKDNVCIECERRKKRGLREKVSQR